MYLVVFSRVGYYDIIKGEEGHNFLQWVLTRVFEATEDDATDAIIDGPNDLGIDAYLPVDFSEDKIYLFQSKYGTSHSMEAIAKFRQDVQSLRSRDITKMRPSFQLQVFLSYPKAFGLLCLCHVSQLIRNFLHQLSDQ